LTIFEWRKVDAVEEDFELGNIGFIEVNFTKDGTAFGDASVVGCGCEPKNVFIGDVIVELYEFGRN
jgi:hypothetical protein